MSFRDLVIKSSKRTIAASLHYSGILNLYRSYVMRQKAVILVYHRIIDSDSELTDYSSYGITVTAANFEKQIKYLSSHYNILRLSDLVRMITTNTPVPDNSCVITFDDGWRDNYTNAYPILKKYNVTATLFLASNFITHGEWYWEERAKYLLAHLFDCAHRESLSKESIDKLKSVLRKYSMLELVDIDSARLPRFLTKSITRIRSNDDSDYVKLFMNDLESLVVLPQLIEPRRFMNWDEIEEIQPVFEIGGHTKSHPDLQNCDSEKKKTELFGSKSVIEDQVKKTVDLFAYPYGKFNDEVIESLKEAGYSSACTLMPGLNSSSTDVFKLQRIDIYNDVAPSVPFFECRVLKFLNSY